MHETLMQYFEWYLPDDCQLWNRVQQEAAHLAHVGVTKVWLPPAYKGCGGTHDVGYGVYDMYDLGEFPSKRTIRTKYGTKEEYLAAIDALHAEGIQVLGDIVLNHRMGADSKEAVRVRRVNPRNRLQKYPSSFIAKIGTRFTFPHRHGTYSDFTWDWHDFTAVDRHDHDGEQQIFLFDGKNWNPNVSDECGNFDYILGVDIDFSSQRVLDELERWGAWYVTTTGVDGFRLDAIKSIDSHFFYGWLAAMKELGNHPSFAVGEYWGYDAPTLRGYLRDCGHCMTLFDVPLHFKFQDASNSHASFDLRSLFWGTLSAYEPEFACVFVDNHDTQPGQALESWVRSWFKPMAYAFILLRDMPYPCVFYGDYCGIPHSSIAPTTQLPTMMWIRKNLLGDEVIDYESDDPNSLCWLVLGAHPVIVVMTNDDTRVRRVDEYSLAGKHFINALNPEQSVDVNDLGTGMFPCARESVAVYIETDDYLALEQAGCSMRRL